MGPEKLIQEFVEKMRAAAGTNLVATILYGSAAAGDFVEKHSDVNLLCVLGETSYASLEALVAVVKWWEKQGHHVPLVIGLNEMRRSADIFSIEFLDMRRHYRVLWGEDVLKSLDIPMRWHRVQLEYELREKTIVLRERLLMVAGKEEAKWELLLRSVPAFGTLFRHTLIALGEATVTSKREAVATLATKLGIDTAVFRELLDIREHKAERKTANIDAMFARYLKLVEEVTGAVDKMLESAA
jgi:predicted nucleotidyltransferase